MEKEMEMVNVVSEISNVHALCRRSAVVAVV
jgi:hypothetical protein